MVLIIEYKGGLLIGTMHLVFVSERALGDPKAEQADIFFKKYGEKTK